MAPVLGVGFSGETKKQSSWVQMNTSKFMRVQKRKKDRFALKTGHLLSIVHREGPDSLNFSEVSHTH